MRIKGTTFALTKSTSNSSLLHIPLHIHIVQMAPPQTKEELLQQISVCEQSSRFDDMVDAMNNLIKISDADLDNEERNLLAMAYQGKLKPRRTSWRILNLLIQQRAVVDVSLSEVLLQVSENYRVRVQTELVDICKEILAIVNDVLLPKTDNVEAKVFYLKLQGDYYRYIAEVETDDERKRVVDLSQQAYKSAFDMATDNDQLKPTHPIRLGIALNYSVFIYQMLNSMENARQMAKKALDDVAAELPKLGKEADSEVTHLLQLIRDNMVMWTPVEP